MKIKDDIVTVMKECPPPYPLSHDEIEKIANLLSETFDGIFHSLPIKSKNEIYQSFIDRYKYIGQNIFRDVNPDAYDMTEFKQEISRRAIPMKDGKSIHLELGVFNVWPDARADAYVKQEGIGDVIRLDMNPAYNLEVAGSVTALPFADESIDRIYSNSLFEHVPYPHEIIREAFRVLRPGGHILTVVPFHFVEHGCPADYLRYTAQFFEQVGTDAGFVDIVTDTKSSSGVYYTTHQMLKAGVAMERDSHPMCQPAQLMHIYSMMLLAGTQALDTFFHAHGASCWHTTYAIMSKPGTYTSRGSTIDRSKPFLDRFKDLICPRSGLPLRREGDEMISLNGTFRYPVVDGKPNLFVMHGFNSSFMLKSSSKKMLIDWNSKNTGG